MTTVVSLKEADRKEFNCALALSPQVSWLLSSCMTSFGSISDTRMSAFYMDYSGGFFRTS